MTEPTTPSRRLDRLLLAAYLVAMMFLLMTPLSGPTYQILGLGIDKYLHFALFGGLAVFLRLNLAAWPMAGIIAVGGAFVFGAATELAQGLVDYRSAELMDLLADLAGAIAGAAIASRIMASPAAEKLIGMTLAVVGSGLIVLFSLADVIGLGRDDSFGSLQIVGTVIGALVTIAGIIAYRTSPASS